jgi:hypothetical protein
MSLTTSAFGATDAGNETPSNMVTGRKVGYRRPARSRPAPLRGKCKKETTRIRTHGQV